MKRNLHPVDEERAKLAPPELLPVDLVDPSKKNPRRQMDKEELAELAASIKERGLQQPILVRKAAGRYEVVYGHRRLEAVKLAELTVIPAFVRELTDDDAEIEREIENLHRVDLHPIDEAWEYERLNVERKMDPVAVAARIGKSRRYVVDRLALIRLSESSEKAFRAGKMELGHARILARLSEEDQAKAMKQLFQETQFRSDNPMSDAHWLQVKARISPEALQRYVEGVLAVDMTKAPFSKSDATLVEKAGACDVCPFRTTSTNGGEDLFGGVITGDRCTRPKCFVEKIEAFFVRQSDKAKEETGKKPIHITGDFYTSERGVTSRDKYTLGKCDFSVPAIFVDRKNYGELAQVCMEPTCPKHRARVQGGGRPEVSAAEKARRKAENLKIRINAEAQRRGFVALMEKVDASPALCEGKALKVIALPKIIDRFMSHDTARSAGKALGLEPVKGQYKQKDYSTPLRKRIQDLTPAQQIVALTVFGAAFNWWGAKDVLAPACKLFGIDTGKIHSAVKKELTAKAAPKKEVKGKKARKPSKAKKAGKA